MQPTEKHFKEARNRVKNLVNSYKKEIAGYKKSIIEMNKKIDLLQSGSIIVKGKVVKATKSALLQTPEIIDKRELAKGSKRGSFREYKGLATLSYS